MFSINLNDYLQKCKYVGAGSINSYLNYVLLEICCNLQRMSTWTMVIKYQGLNNIGQRCWTMLHKFSSIGVGLIRFLKMQMTMLSCNCLLQKESVTKID
jgi:hypothetical protein